MITGALPMLAGLTDPRHEIYLLDENVEEICFESLQRFDVVGVTGMNVQKRRMKEILGTDHFRIDSNGLVCLAEKKATTDSEGQP